MSDQELENTKKGIALFNKQQYYEAHEAWEKNWLDSQVLNKKIYQGLIFLTAAFVHIQKQKLLPAKKAITKSAPLLRAVSPKNMHINLNKLLQQISLWQKLIDVALLNNDWDVINKHPPICIE